jgi:hypothetical protein
MVGFQARDVIGPGGGGSSAGAACDRTGGRTFWDGRALAVGCVRPRGNRTGDFCVCSKAQEQRFIRARMMKIDCRH